MTIFLHDLSQIIKNISVENVIIDEFEFLYRDVKFFVQHLKLVISCHDVSFRTFRVLKVSEF